MNVQQEDESRYGPHALQPASWSQDRRLKFIDFRLRWDGRVNRSDLIDYFKISAPQASNDLGKYTEAAPFNMNYDLKVKSYVRADGFAPLFARSSSRLYANELLAVVSDVIEPKASFIGWRPDVGVVPAPHRTLDGRSLSLVLQAIRERRRLAITYQGMRRAEPVARAISPHALGFDGFRWHVRAYCHLRERYQDFVVGRMAGVLLGERSDHAAAGDVHWHTSVTLVLAPHPDLPAGAKRAVRMEYGMTDGTTRLQCRQALLFYTLRRLGLQRAGAPAAAQQIVLLNERELQPYLDQMEEGV